MKSLWLVAVAMVAAGSSNSELEKLAYEGRARAAAVAAGIGSPVVLYEKAVAALPELSEAESAELRNVVNGPLTRQVIEVVSRSTEACCLANAAATRLLDGRSLNWGESMVVESRAWGRKEMQLIYTLLWRARFHMEGEKLLRAVGSRGPRNSAGAGQDGWAAWC